MPGLRRRYADSDDDSSEESYDESAILTNLTWDEVVEIIGVPRPTTNEANGAQGEDRPSPRRESSDANAGECSNNGDKNNESDQAQNNDSDRAQNNDSDQSPNNDSDRAQNNDSDQAPNNESDQAQNNDSDQAQNNDSDQAPNNESDQAPNNESDQAQNKESPIFENNQKPDVEHNPNSNIEETNESEIIADGDKCNGSGGVEPQKKICDIICEEVNSRELDQPKTMPIIQEPYDPKNNDEITEAAEDLSVKTSDKFDSESMIYSDLNQNEVTKSCVQMSHSKTEPNNTIQCPPNLEQLNSFNIGVPQATDTPCFNKLATLSDDMYVLEAPSFITPFVYEKPAAASLKTFVDQLKEGIDNHAGVSSRKDLDLYAQDGENSLPIDLSKPKVVKDEFANPLGKFFMDIGTNLVEEYVKKDLLTGGKRLFHKEMKCSVKNLLSTKCAHTSLIKNVETTSGNNANLKRKAKKCHFCSFETESRLVMAHHMETPHKTKNTYRCSYCLFETKTQQDIILHTETEHKLKCRIEKPPTYHSCPNCPYGNNSKSNLARHSISCAKRFKPETNQMCTDWETPGKVSNPNNYKSLSFCQPINTKPNLVVAKGNPTTVPIYSVTDRPIEGRIVAKASQPIVLPNYNNQGSRPMANPMVPPKPHEPFQMRSNELTIIRHNKGQMVTRPVQELPSISITPVPSTSSVQTGPPRMVVCEICDEYILNSAQLKNHLLLCHNLKLHPKIIFGVPPLNCQKCNNRFFTDQGLERHLLGYHGLVTDFMQEAANKQMDGGKCSKCGRVYQWRLLSHMVKDHKMTLKAAHLSYKCTVCLATFSMFKYFETHIHSSHSIVARRVTDIITPSATTTRVEPKSKPILSSEQLYELINRSRHSNEPININDELTIIPLPLTD